MNFIEIVKEILNQTIDSRFEQYDKVCKSFK